MIERTNAGFVVRLEADEVRLLRQLLGELVGLVNSDDPATEPIRRRLFPPAYHLLDDAEAEAEYQRLMREELVASRLAAFAGVDAVLAAADDQTAVLDEAGMVALMQSLNAVRLVLGTMLDIGEADELDEIGTDHPMYGEHHLYAFLSWLLEMAVQAVSEPDR